MLLNAIAIRDTFKIQIKVFLSKINIMKKNVLRLLPIFIISLPAISLVSWEKNSSLTNSMPKNTQMFFNSVFEAILILCLAYEE